ncbi:Homogentisate phytyltransferase 1, chloroplastic [Glycine soja]|nr:Homogentisate phytyltransferase 1, chloroplastic [Glycine soja]
MIGLALCALSSSLLAVEKLSDISLSFFVGVLQAAVPQLFFAIYSNALNQVSDLEIDKINKPHLPLASGQLSLKTVVIIAASFLTLSFWLSWIVGSWPLIWNLVLITSIWTAYSVNVPFLRWKKNPILAAMCMVSSWAFVLPITFFLHMQTFVLKRPIVFPRSLILAIVIMNFFFVGMALAKDIPDVEGDKIYGIDTFAIRIGQKQVFWICIFLFEMAFGVSLVAGATSSSLLVKIITGVGNAVLASVLWFQANSIDLSSKTSGGSFYMLIWKVIHLKFIYHLRSST